MNTWRARLLLGFLALTSSMLPLARAGEPAASASPPLLATLQQELERARAELSKSDPAPYFISYGVFDRTELGIVASEGALITSLSGRRRTGAVTMRIGSAALDNTHDQHRSSGITSGLLPLSDDRDAVSRVLWQLTDREYKRASEAFLNVKTSTAVRAREEGESPDFSPAKPGDRVGAGDLNFTPDVRSWEEKLRRYSALFRRYPEIYRSFVALMVEGGKRYFVSTEGGKIVEPGGVIRLVIQAGTRADDGMELVRLESFQARSLDRLPGDAQVAATVERIASDLRKLRAAPLAEPFDGPALLSGRATAVFFHEVLGHRLEGQRQRGNVEGQTFTRKINAQVLPSFLSVVDDPTLREMGGQELSGWYEYDEEGVAASPVTVIQQGILKDFLMSRMPVKDSAHSNGHGRADEAHMPVGRQGNLIVTSTRSEKDSALRQKLIEEVKRQGKPYGLYFEDIQGGFTLTTRVLPQSFQVLPVLVWKVYPDGRPDELVRGVDIVGTPLSALEHILLTGDTPQVFNGICVAESGAVPVSAVAPAMLFSEVEVQRRAKSNERPPILPPPGFESAEGAK